MASSILSLIESPARAVRAGGLAISSVRLACLYDRAPATLTFTFAIGKCEPKKSALKNISVMACRRLPDRTLQVPARPAKQLEEELLECAWRLGAWDVSRFEFAPLAEHADHRDPKYGISIAFGHNPYLIDGECLVEGDGADPEILQCAAREGRIGFSFVPLALATDLMQRDFGPKDRTLRADCTREGAAPFPRTEFFRPRKGAHQHIYQLGRGPHGNRSQKSKARRADGGET